MLPSNSFTPANPWSEIMVNANCATCAHRDVRDNYCMVIVVSDCEGDNLVFHELGLVFSTKNGNASIFHSAELTHYNII